MNINEYKQALTDYQPAAKGETDRSKVVAAREAWEALHRHYHYTPEHRHAFEAWKDARQQAARMAQPTQILHPTNEAHTERMRDKEEEYERALEKEYDAWREENYNRREGMI